MKTKLMMVVVDAMVMNLFAVPTVSNVSARQRYPWNGLVDIDVTVTGIEGTSGNKFLKVEAINRDSDSALDVMSFTSETCGLLVSSIKTNGTYCLVWNAYADLQDVIIEKLQINVSFADKLQGGGVRLWANGPCFAFCNIGAEQPEDAGLYFWWGDTVGYKRDNNRWVATDGSSSDFRFHDDAVSRSTEGKDNVALENERWTRNGELAPEHDAATAYWGGKWRMPTADEISQLNTNCTWTWMSRNGMNGYEVRGRGDYANAWIFIPAADLSSWSSLCHPGSDGRYWSSTPRLGSPNLAFCLTFNSGSHSRSQSSRSDGFPVRAVSDGNR